MFAKIMTLIRKGKVIGSLVMKLLSAVRDLWGTLKASADQSKK